MDIAEEFGADKGFSTQKLCLYMPNKDKSGRLIRNHEKWVKEAREILSRIGTTALPPADGTWEKESGEILWERTHLIYCFIDADEFEAHVKDLRGFLHRFGSRTKQGEVVVEFDRQFFRITKFDEQPG
jgi:hypothetical protein